MTDQGAYGVVALTLTAFGLAVPVPAFVGGMGLALGMCFAVMMVRPISARRGVFTTLFMGALAGMLVAILHSHTGSVWLWGSLPVQAQMAFAGIMSQAAFEFVATRDSGILVTIADKLGLPKKDA